MIIIIEKKRKKRKEKKRKEKKRKEKKRKEKKRKEKERKEKKRKEKKRKEYRYRLSLPLIPEVVHPIGDCLDEGLWLRGSHVVCSNVVLISTQHNISYHPYIYSNIKK